MEFCEAEVPAYKFIPTIINVFLGIVKKFFNIRRKYKNFL